MTEMHKESLQRLNQILNSAGRKLSFEEALNYGKFIAALHEWCKDSLSQMHLVEVASALNKGIEITLSEMAMLDIPVDILECFPHWKEGSRHDFRPPNCSLHLPLIGASHPQGLLRLQLSPFSPTLSAALLLLRRLSETVDPNVKFLVAVEPGGNLEALHDIVGAFSENMKDRVSLVELQTTSIFAQDNARGARTKAGEPAILIPRGFRQERERQREALDTQVHSKNLKFPIHRSSLFWEGGNIANDDVCCFIGVDHIRENMTRLGLSKEEVISLFHSEFGTEVEFLGKFEDTAYHPGEFRPYSTGQASFHIDLDFAPLGTVLPGEAPVALLASPKLGLEYMDEVLEIKRLVSDHFLEEQEVRRLVSFEYKTHAEERIEKLISYRNSLVERGYRVVEVPDLRIDPRDNLFGTRNFDLTYCNVLVGNHSGSPTIYSLPFGIPSLDSRAAQAYEEANCCPVRVSRTGRLANLLMLFSGGLRCACSQIY